MPPTGKREMHPRNVFRQPPDYTELAIKYREFRQVCKLNLNGRVSIDYKNESALRALTRMLLKEYFDLDVVFAPGSLVPTVPLRLNYLLWVEDLLKEQQADTVRGIDIGCGSSCIYSLLAAKKCSWQMYALESNPNNIQYAMQNVAKNDLEPLITIIAQKNPNVIFKDFFTDLDSTAKFDFCLCNPPFYDSSMANPFDSTTRNHNKRAPPHNCHTGQADELSCIGGEVSFVQRIIDESLNYKDRVRIFTSMLGHQSSLSKILEFLQSNNITNYCSTEFCQGNTTRWGVAWSFAINFD